MSQRNGQVQTLLVQTNQNINPTNFVKYLLHIMLSTQIRSPQGHKFSMYRLRGI